MWDVCGILCCANILVKASAVWQLLLLTFASGQKLKRDQQKSPVLYMLRKYLGSVYSSTHSLTSRILLLFGQYTDDDESSDSSQTRRTGKHKNLSLPGLFLTTAGHNTTLDEREPPNLKESMSQEASSLNLAEFALRSTTCLTDTQVCIYKTVDRGGVIRNRISHSALINIDVLSLNGKRELVIREAIQRVDRNRHITHRL